MPIPERVRAYLLRAVETETRAYVLNGGNRNFRHEDVQDEAKAWLEAQPAEPSRVPTEEAGGSDD